MGTKIESKYRKTLGTVKNYPPGWQGGQRRASRVGNSLLFQVFVLYFDPMLVPILQTI